MLHMQVSKRRWVFFLLFFTALMVAGAAQTIYTSQAERLSSSDRSEVAYAGLESSNAAERAATILSIHRSGNRAAVPALLGELGDSDTRVGLYAAQALGDLAGKDALPALRTALRDENSDVRWQAALALGQLRDTVSVPDLERALSDPELMVRKYAASALQMIGNEDAAQALVNALGSGDQATSHIVLGALEEIGETAVKPLVRALDSTEPQVRLESATALGYIASPRALPALQLATIDSEPAVQAEVTWAIEQIEQKG